MRKKGNVFENVETVRYTYNSRSELVTAQSDLNEEYKYMYTFDNIGNRISGSERHIKTSYMSNNLNQYSAIDSDFIPTYDADGNQTRIKTSTGIWEVEYNAENRPIMFKNAKKRIHNMSYDYMGRRFRMSSYLQGMHDGDSTELFYYNGYTLIESVKSLPWPQLGKFIKKSYLWDPTAKEATRPLVMIDNNNEPFYYTHDANKNVTELISQNGIISAHYEYSPFGAVTVSSGTLSTINPFRFSSEYHDDELGLVYYNYRHYNSLDGRWISRDPIEEDGGWNLYGINLNNLVNYLDLLGKITLPFEITYGHDLTWKRISGTLTILLDCSEDYPSVEISLDPQSYDAELSDKGLRWRNNYYITVEYSFENVSMYLFKQDDCYDIYTVTYGIRKKINGIHESIQPNNVYTYSIIEEEWYTMGDATNITCCTKSENNEI